MEEVGDRLVLVLAEEPHAHDLEALEDEEVDSSRVASIELLPPIRALPSLLPDHVQIFLRSLLDDRGTLRSPCGSINVAISSLALGLLLLGVFLVLLLLHDGLSVKVPRSSHVLIIIPPLLIHLIQHHSVGAIASLQVDICDGLVRLFFLAVQLQADDMVRLVLRFFGCPITRRDFHVASSLPLSFFLHLHITFDWFPCSLARLQFLGIVGIRLGGPVRVAPGIFLGLLVHPALSLVDLFLSLDSLLR
mmetsp:Transcript_12687/g.29213  ORF Transcript_12687/g.29213 Transcript_12687/m.29213 type:complete len:248 (+) Transcript_12687:1246-1989(+)